MDKWDVHDLLSLGHKNDRVHALYQAYLTKSEPLPSHAALSFIVIFCNFIGMSVSTLSGENSHIPKLWNQTQSL